MTKHMVKLVICPLFLMMQIIDYVIIIENDNCQKALDISDFILILHAFWVILGFIGLLALQRAIWLSTYFGHIFLCSARWVGIDEGSMEPANCEEWKNNVIIWYWLQQGGVTPFLERLHGNDQRVTKTFVKEWKNGKLDIFGKVFVVDESLVAEVINLSIEGIKFYKDRNLSDGTIKKFPKIVKEKENLVRVNKSNFEKKQIKPIWRELLKVIMEFFTLDDKFMKIYGYHFVMLNHFRHKVNIYFPFYFLSSLNANINEHRENPHINPVIHQGLILPIYDQFKAKASENPNKALSASYYDGEGSGSSENGGWDNEDEEEEVIPPSQET